MGPVYHYLCLFAPIFRAMSSRLSLDFEVSAEPEEDPAPGLEVLPPGPPPPPPVSSVLPVFSGFSTLIGPSVVCSLTVSLPPGEECQTM